MFSRIISRVVAVVCLAGLMVDAHTVLTYPGSRGNNLITNDTFSYGMQWMYPCGGMPTSNNRTKWPINGGAIALQPGWFQGHATAFFYMNLGFGTNGPDNGPPNMSFPMLPVFQIQGPDAFPYPGTFCLPQVPLPKWNGTVNVGDNATIQIVETAIHGAALYTCVDITFADPADGEIAEVNSSNCFNSSQISFNNVFSVATGEGTGSGAFPSLTLPTTLISLSVGLMWMLL